MQFEVEVSPPANGMSLRRTSNQTWNFQKLSSAKLNPGGSNQNPQIRIENQVGYIAILSCILFSIYLGKPNFVLFLKLLEQPLLGGGWVGKGRQDMYSSWLNISEPTPSFLWPCLAPFHELLSLCHVLPQFCPLLYSAVFALLISVYCELF